MVVPHPSIPLHAGRLVGRKDEANALSRLLRESVAAQRLMLAVIAGPAGVGKSRLLDDVVQAHPDLRRINARHSEAVRGPYLGLHLAFERAATRCDDRLRPVFEEVAAVLATDDGLEKSRRFATVARALLRAATHGPLLLSVDDLQWADSATVDLIRFLVIELEHEPLSIILTARPEGEARLLEQFPRALHVRVAPLPRECIADLLLEALPDGVADADRDDIVRLADGNPLVALELLRHRRDGSTSFPPSIAAPIRRRLRSMHPAAQAVTETAAVADAFDIPLLADVLEMPPDGVLAALKDAQRAELVVRDGEGWRFVHALTQAAVIDAIEGERVRSIHGRVGARLEAAAESEPARLAHHWWMAGDHARAARYSAAAGTRASEMASHHDAIPHLERALALAPKSLAERARLAELLGFSLLVTGRFADASRALDLAKGHYQTLGDREGIVRVSLNCSRLHYSVADMVAMNRAADLAVTLVESGEPSALGFRTWVHVAQNRLYAGSHASARKALDGARRHRAQGEGQDLAAYEVVRARIALHAGDLAAFRTHADAAVEAAESLGRIEQLTAVLHNLGTPAADSGIAQEGKRMLERSLQLSKSYGLHYNAAMTQLGLSFVDWLEGRLTAAAARFEGTLVAAQRFPQTRFWTVAYGVPIALSVGDAELLDRVERAATFEEALATGNDGVVGGVSRALAHRELARSRPDVARDVLGRGLASLREPRMPSHLAAWIAIAGRAEDLPKALDRLRTTTSIAGRADGALLEAEMARRRKHRRAVVIAADRAATLFGQLGWPLWRARALASAGRRSEAVSIANGLGDATWLATTDREERKSTLTPREREVAVRAAQGRSNKAIADELGLSARTVENYLQSAFTRLGVHARGELREALRQA